MRISDWSSDVCSSDLASRTFADGGDKRLAGQFEDRQSFPISRTVNHGRSNNREPAGKNLAGGDFAGPLAGGIRREMRFARGERGEDELGRASGRERVGTYG